MLCLKVNDFHVLIIVFSVITPVPASSSVSFENFEAGVCITRDDDILLENKSYHGCIRECQARGNCVSANVHTGTATCRLSVGEGTEQACDGFVFSKKSSWEKKELTECSAQPCAPRSTCLTTGESSKATCKITECPSLPTPDNCALLGNGNQVGKTVLYACKYMYKIEGGATRTCLNTGVWSGAEPKCVPYCLTGWIKYQTSCYLLGSVSIQTFEQAQDYCKSRGSGLVIMDTEEENSFIKRYLMSNLDYRWKYVSYFIGLNDIQTEGTWRWTYNGTPTEVTDWYMNRPNGGVLKNCVVMTRYFNFKWSDTYCNYTYAYFWHREALCEFNHGPLNVITTNNEL